MCHDPSTLKDGTVVACRKCELCRYNRVKDWAGRHIAQSKVSTGSFACTLTYGPELDQYPVGHAGEYGQPIPGRSDHIRMAVLTYSDVQKFLKYLRTGLGYNVVGYMVTGEKGSEKDRAHWHIILHFKGRVPSHEEQRNFSDRHVNQFGQLFTHDVCKAWPHGFMWWKRMEFNDAFYNCKYILKDEDDEAAQRKPGMSKKPPLGAEYFANWADQFVAAHLAPQSLEYRFPEIKKKDGSPLIFYLKGRSAELFLERYIVRWKAVHGDKKRPNSQLVDLFEKYGKIVTDEARMLLRQEFPKGESRAAIPTGEQIKAIALEVKAERDQKLRELAQAEKDNWQTQWIGDAPNGEERQRRQSLIEFEQFGEQLDVQQRFERFLEYKAKHSFAFVFGRGWVYTGSQPNPAGSESFLQWQYLDRHSAGSRELGVERQQLPSGAAGLLQRSDGTIDTDPRGKIGRWNKAYGTGEDA